jgi:hypothetical protein
VLRNHHKVHKKAVFVENISDSLRYRDHGSAMLAAQLHAGVDISGDCFGESAKYVSLSI